MLDPRLHAFRADLADAALHGRVEPPASPRAIAQEVVEPIVALHAAAAFRCHAADRAAHGREGAGLRTRRRLGVAQGRRATAMSAMLRHPAWRASSASDASRRRSRDLPLSRPGRESGARTARPDERCGRDRAEDGKFARTAGGRFVYAPHLKPLCECRGRTSSRSPSSSWTCPICWGGKTALGLDCSGLVQTALQAAGIRLPARYRHAGGRARRSRSTIHGALRRGDLVFWNGHVGIMVDAERLLHANGHLMQVTLRTAGDGGGAHRLRPMAKSPASSVAVRFNSRACGRRRFSKPPSRLDAS